MHSLTNWVSQVSAVAKLSLQTVVERKGAAASAAFGIAGVVAVLIGVLSIAQGFRRAMTVGGSPDVAMVMRSGADSEMVSGFSRNETRLITDSPAIARTERGALASAELFVILNLPKRATGTDANVPMRGVEGAAFEVRRNSRIVEGRRFENGRNEVIVGIGAAREFAGLDLGGKFKVGRNEWEVVGIFSADGGIAESEVWTDAVVLQSAYQRGDSFQSVYAKLKSGDAFQEFKDELTANPQLNVKVLRQTEYYEEQSKMVYQMVTVLGTLVGVLMGLGAIFGALNTMYSAVAARTREIATLRALGFGGGPVLLSVLIESLVLALAGGCAGAAVAYFGFDGFRTATLNFQSFSQVAFAFDVTPALLLAGIISASVIGLIGGFFPALRAVRMPVASALREL